MGRRFFRGRPSALRSRTTDSHTHPVTLALRAQHVVERVLWSGSEQFRQLMFGPEGDRDGCKRLHSESAVASLKAADRVDGNTGSASEVVLAHSERHPPRPGALTKPRGELARRIKTMHISSLIEITQP